MDNAHRMLGEARRVVVKVGSSSLTVPTRRPGRRGSIRLDRTRIDRLVDVLADAVTQGRDIVLVSSGAIAAGLEPLQLGARPRDLATQQAAASVGQMLLVHAYSESFRRHGLKVAQVLLTADDLQRRAHYRNAQRNLDRLLQLGVVPIVNENDAVATDEIRFGDNDRLAALTAHLVNADGLILLSDVDGVYDANPNRGNAHLISQITDETMLASVDTTGASRAGVGTGGMATKIDSARIASGAGVPVIITSMDRAADALAGRTVGTFVHKRGKRPPQRRFWLRWASVPKGYLTLDDGAVRAVVKGRKSLLPAGVTGVSGSFAAGDAIELRDQQGIAVARGLSAYDSIEIPAMLGKQSTDLDTDHQRELIHRDDIAVL